MLYQFTYLATSIRCVTCNGLETQAKVYATSVIRFILEPCNFTLNTFQEPVFTYFKIEQKCEYNYRLLKLSREINKAENHHLMLPQTFFNNNNGDISVVKKNANIQRWVLALLYP